MLRVLPVLMCFGQHRQRQSKWTGHDWGRLLACPALALSTHPYNWLTWAIPAPLHSPAHQPRADILLLSPNLRSSPARVDACWPAELLRMSRRFGAKGGPKPSQNRPPNCLNMPRNHSQSTRDHFGARPLLTNFGPKIGHFGVPVRWETGRRARPPQRGLVREPMRAFGNHQNWGL